MTLWAMGSGGKPEDHAVAALVGLDLRGVAWPQFWEERAVWKAKPPYTWDKRLFEPPSGLAIGDEAVACLNKDAKSVLALGVLCRRELGTTFDHLLRKALLSVDRLGGAIRDLEGKGLLRLPGPQDLVAALTVEQISKLFPEVEKPAGAKAVYAQAVAEAVSEGQLTSRLSGTPADDVQLVIGLNRGKEADWLISFSMLVAHWLMMRSFRIRDVDPRRWAGQGPQTWAIAQTDRCRSCRAHGEVVVTTTAGIGAVDELPPFHIGCRCSATPTDGVPAISVEPARVPVSVAAGSDAVPRNTARTDKPAGFGAALQEGWAKGRKGTKRKSGTGKFLKGAFKSDGFKFGKF
jgi:hypothetical protein